MRSRNIDIVHVNAGGRVIAFRRSSGSDELLIVASFSNSVFDGYAIQTEASAKGRVNAYLRERVSEIRGSLHVVKQKSERASGAAY